MSNISKLSRSVPAVRKRMRRKPVSVLLATMTPPLIFIIIPETDHEGVPVESCFSDKDDWTGGWNRTGFSLGDQDSKLNRVKGTGFRFAVS
jgi:hypothetical protein